MTTYEYTLACTIDAPVEKVWTAFTNPTHYAVWFNAVPDSVKLDVRTGGTWSSTLVTPEGQEIPLSGGYGEVVENKFIQFTMDVPGQAPEAMEFSFEAAGEQTNLSVHQASSTQEGCDMSKQGSEYLLASLSSYVPTI